MRRVYEYDDRPEISGSYALRHRAIESDATLCDAYIDTNWSDQEPDENTSVENCQVCVTLAIVNVQEIARRQVAQELGVDESEVF